MPKVKIPTKYRSKLLIEEKLKQLKFVYLKRIKPYEGKVFVNSGRDKDSGCYPFDVDFSNFLTISRNIFQYALTEIKKNKNKNRNLYDKYVEGKPLIKFFKNLRNEEIHIAPGGHLTTISFTSSFKRDGKSLDKMTEKEINEEAKKAKPAVVTYEILRIIMPSNRLYNKFKSEGRQDLIKTIDKGKPIYEVQKFGAESNLFNLCEEYIKEIELFISYGIKKGFIT